MCKAALSAALSIGLVAPATLLADLDNQRTELEVNQAIEVPGATLEPGEYVIELAGSQSGNDVVVFRDTSTDEAVAMAMTIDTKAEDVPDETEFTFYESPAGDPPALRAWYYPGDVRGHKFVYPEGRSKEIAKSSRRHVPTATDADYEKLSSTSVDKNFDPALIAVREITVYSLSPDAKKASMDEGAEWNREADAKTLRPGEYLRSRIMASSGQQSLNPRVANQIRKEIVTLPFYSIWDHVEFKLNGDEVTLMGSVYRPSMKKSVERVVENVEGVQAVNNQLDVQPTSPNDDRIRRAAYQAIYGHTALQDYQLRAVPPIHIIVENGKLTLEGVVQNEMDKNIAGVQANSVNGVFEVTNNLRTDSDTQS
jgi:hyperosmotically inducible protein